MASRGRRHWFQKEICMWTSHSIYDPSYQFSDEFMVLVPSFKSSSAQYEAHSVNYGLTQRKIDQTAGNVWMSESPLALSQIQSGYPAKLQASNLCGYFMIQFRSSPPRTSEKWILEYNIKLNAKSSLLRLLFKPLKPFLLKSKWVFLYNINVELVTFNIFLKVGDN